MKRILIPAFVFGVTALSLGACSNNPGDKCANVTCSAGQVCDSTTGMCTGGTGNKCTNVTCPSGMTCDANTGMCTGTGNLCATVTCSNGQSCDPTDGTCKNPQAPMLTGMQIDRMGRPGINTATTNPFGILPANSPEMPDDTKDTYNHDSDPSKWAANWTPFIAANLAILDSLDGTCGNQLLYNGKAAGGGTATATSYAALATVLANDELQLDTSQKTCKQYLGVEAAFVTGMADADCGGRTLDYDVIDVTYTVLATGGTKVVTDGISETTMPTATFPFMQPPK